MFPRRRLVGWMLTLTMLSLLAAPLARAADSDEFPVPQSTRFT